MNNRKLISRDSNLVYFTLNDGITTHCATIQQWKLYELKNKIHTEYNVPMDELDELEQVVSDLRREEDAYQD